MTKINADHGTNNEDTFRLLRDSVPIARVIDGAEVGKKVRCISPDHDDQNPSMEVYEDHVFCFSCEFQGDVTKVWSILHGFDKQIDAARDLARAFNVVLSDEAQPSSNGSASKEEGCTLTEYAEYVGIPEDFLRDLRLKEIPYVEQRAVRMPYFDESGAEEVCVRIRVSLTGEPKVKTRKGDKHRLYGLWKLDEAREKGCVILVEGESDSQVGWYHGEPVIGIPGASSFQSGWAQDLDGIEKVYAVVEPDKGGEKLWGSLAAERSLRDRLYKVQLDGPKDLRDLHRQEDRDGFKERLHDALRRGVHWNDAASDSANSANSANGVSDETEEPEPWVAPAAFHSVSLPEFPRGVFPAWVEAQVEGTAEATQTPRDLSGMLALGVGAAAIAKVVEVEIWEGWREQTNLYAATGMRSGSRKTTVFQRMTAPIEEHEAQLVEDTAEEIAEQRTRYKIYEERLKKAQTKAAKAEGDELHTLTAEAMTAASDLESIKVPATPRLLVDDASPERVASMLAEQGGRLALMSPEGGVFDMMAGRYSQGIPNLDVYLKGHAGDALRVDRVGRPADHVRKPALTIALAVQPDVLQGLAGRPGFRGRGLIGRHLYSIPKDTLGRRVIRPKAVPERVGQKYAEKLRALLGLADDLPVEEREAEVLRFGTEAQDEMEAFLEWIEPTLAEDGELGDMTDWAGKLAGAVARIAGILHMFDHAGKKEPWKQRVSGETMRRAVKVGHYLIPHAKHALAVMGSDPTVEDAKYVLRWIERKGGERFTKRDAFEGTKGRFGKVSEMEPALDLLVSHGYLREHHPEERRGAGRKPSPTYEVNPVWLAESNQTKQERPSQNSQYSQNSEEPEAEAEDDPGFEF